MRGNVEVMALGGHNCIRRNTHLGNSRWSDVTPRTYAVAATRCLEDA